jgi:superfamily II DNA/RNA helicase
MGKTSAFYISLLQNLDYDDHRLQCLTINHSRELARQQYYVYVNTQSYLYNN